MPTFGPSTPNREMFVNGFSTPAQPPKFIAVRRNNEAGMQVFNSMAIPVGVTIDSATLASKGCNLNGGTQQTSIKVELQDLTADPASPNLTDLQSGNPIDGNVAVIFTGQYTPTPSTPNYWTTSHFNPTAGKYKLANIDVQAMVAALVAKYDYSAGDKEMVFFLTENNGHWTLVEGSASTLKIVYTLPLILVDKTTYRFV